MLIEATSITRAAHRLWPDKPVLGAEYIGEVAKGQHIEWFESCPCPEGLDEWACDAETRKGAGIHKGIYHWQAWVLQMRCPHCKADGFKALESRRQRTEKNHGSAGPPCIVCGKCSTVLEVYRMEHPGLERKGQKNWNKRVTA